MRPLVCLCLFLCSTACDDVATPAPTQASPPHKDDARTILSPEAFRTKDVCAALLDDAIAQRAFGHSLKKGAVQHFKSTCTFTVDTIGLGGKLEVRAYPSSEASKKAFAQHTRSIKASKPKGFEAATLKDHTSMMVARPQVLKTLKEDIDVGAHAAMMTSSTAYKGKAQVKTIVHVRRGNLNAKISFDELTDVQKTQQVPAFIKELGQRLDNF